MKLYNLYFEEYGKRIGSWLRTRRTLKLRQNAMERMQDIIESQQYQMAYLKKEERLVQLHDGRSFIAQYDFSDKKSWPKVISICEVYKPETKLKTRNNGQIVKH